MKIKKRLALQFTYHGIVTEKFIKKGRKVLTMASIDEQILRATKEIVVKFIEGGRISPSGFHDAFKGIYETVQTTVNAPTAAPEPENQSH